MLGSWWAVALELSVKSTAVLASACVASLLLRRASAVVRHLVWMLALGSLLLLPALKGLLPAWRTSPLPGGSVSISESRTFELARGHVPPRLPPHGRLSERWVMAAFGVWMAGALVCLRRWTNGIKQVAHLRQHATPFMEDHVRELVREHARQLGLRGEVSLLLSDGEMVPMATGFRYPAVVLPANASHWSIGRLRVVLLHEMAHIQRKDCITQALAELAFCVYWINPLVWFAMRRLRVERERACDDLVLCAGNRASDYAAHLLDLARALPARELSLSAIGMAGSSHLETRLRAILNPRQNRRAFTRAAGVTACLATACLVLPLAAMRPQAGSSRMVSGTVYDAEAARVPDARVVLGNIDTGQKHKVSTDQTGQFSIGPLADGTYRLEVDSRGFAPAIRTLKVDGGHEFHFDITLDVGSVLETVVVRGKGTAAATAAPRRIRVGGNVSPAKLISQVKPEYPEAVRSRGVQGDVVLRAVILLDGTPASLTAVASPDPELTEAAMNAVRRWRYDPSLLNGKPVETVTTITVNFQLEP